MSKHKHFHSLSGKGKVVAIYAFHHKAPATGSRYSPRPKQKKAAPDAANIRDGRVEQTLTGPVSTSHDNGK